MRKLALGSVAVAGVFIANYGVTKSVAHPTADLSSKVSKSSQPACTITVSDVNGDKTIDMWTFVGNKNNDVWIWTAVFDKKYKFFSIGKRDEDSFWKFYDNIPLSEEYETDGYKVYDCLESRVVKKYGATNWNEGLHSFLRQKLAMLKRKTKAYAKSLRALQRGLAMVFLRWNLIPI